MYFALLAEKVRQNGWLREPTYVGVSDGHLDL